jgi:hypothetical protein
MNMLLAFVPFIAFAVLDRTVGATEGLIAGALVSAALVARDWLSPTRSPKVLEIGTVILFGSLAIYTLATNPEWSIIGVRLCVDAGLLLIVLASVAIRQPFTLQYARERVPAEHWGSPLFVRTNYAITAVWALAFAAVVIAEVVMLYVPEIPHRVGVVVTIIALAAAFKFTDWYPQRVGDGSALSSATAGASPNINSGGVERASR